MYREVIDVNNNNGIVIMINGKGRIMKRKILLVLLIIWIGFIFFNSIKSAPDSIKESSVLVDTVKNVITFVYKGDVPDKTAYYIENSLSPLIRSLAHIFEFFVLYILFYFNLKYYAMCGLKLLLNGLYAVLIVATIDESIQIFSSGRAFQVSDLILDLLGGLIAFIILYIYSKYIRKDYGVCSV